MIRCNFFTSYFFAHFVELLFDFYIDKPDIKSYNTYEHLFYYVLLKVYIMKGQTCCFSGHRNIPESEYIELKKQLRDVVSILAKRGIIYFGCGGARGFDMLAAETVIEMKRYYPDIRLIMVYPCRDQTRFWNNKDTEIYNIIKQQCDKYVYISESYTSNCMLLRNKHLVNNSRYCICYFTGVNSGTSFTVNYAASHGLTIINLAKYISTPFDII